ncbi:hypothetical protein [Streptomyces sp. NPDC049555]|uniref:hypothetical protein n=1 Tax=Streptomyces sp. NPDC049555 TaxID=3154930 RepID=UPI003423A549
MAALASGSALSTDGPAQRGRETVLHVTLEEVDGPLTVESPAFAKPLLLKPKRFHEGKDGSHYTDVAGMVLCDIAPGTYVVELKRDGEKEPLDSLDLTVTPDMDAANREFCASPRGYGEAVDRTSETAPDEDEADDEAAGGVTTAQLAVAVAATAALSAALTAMATYLVVRRRR